MGRRFGGASPWRSPSGTLCELRPNRAHKRSGRTAPSQCEQRAGRPRFDADVAHWPRNWIEDLRTLLNAPQTLWRTGWLALLLLHSSAAARPPPLSIEEMRAREHVTRLEPVRSLIGGPGFDARLVSYLSSGLKIHALVATPRTGRPESGFPVLVANHGHHPDPPRYGITAQGLDARPGDYYRRIPELYASLGFLVVMPDYRGHGESEGLEFTEGMLESLYYTEDVLALLPELADLSDADPENLFMWGHSMGGEVTLRALLATDRVRGASLWSSVGGELWDQAFYYSRYEDDLAPDSGRVPKQVVDGLKRDIAALDGPFDWRGSEPLRHLHYLTTPLILHHALGDRGAPYEWSARLAKELYLRSVRYEFYSYPGKDHLFRGTSLEEAAERDAAFFRSLIKP